MLDYGYLTGWRRGEILSLEWRDVDRSGSVIRLFQGGVQVSQFLGRGLGDPRRVLGDGG